MQHGEMKNLEGWVAFLTRADIPVLKTTARDLTAWREDDENISARSISEIIARDPMMTVKLLRYLQHHKRSKQEHEVMEVEQAMLMLGVDAFFTKLPPEPLTDEMLRAHTAALVSLLRVVRRAQHASAYALDWALRLRDLHFEEVRIAALLHDLAELLMWCFAPVEMLKIHAMKQQDKSLRSHDAQTQVLGFSLVELQSALTREWGLPKLLLTLMDDKCADQERVRNVVLAVNLARHLANGWDDAALPDDYKDIGQLLGMPPDNVMIMIGTEEDTVCDVVSPHF
ncbi:MAG: HDOD domain-containing protein [Betaproteobacteria bacterium]|nr:HDOD domain-containing protein [Betaproteobacteria bacterium]